MDEPIIQQEEQVSAAHTKDFWNSSYFAELDGLRALSLLLVIGGHTRIEVPMKYYFSGGLGVGIFFVLSGFLITTLLIRENLLGSGNSLPGFYIRRCFRILPMYFVTLVLYFLATAWSRTNLHRFLSVLPYDLSLRNEYVPKTLDAIFTHSWSLSVEEKFYLFWPMVFVFLVRRPKRWLLVLPIALAPLLISTTETLPVAYFSILTGCVAAFVLQALSAKAEQTKRLLNAIPAWFALAVWAASYVVSIQSTWRTVFIVATALFIPKLLVDYSWPSKVFGSRPLQYIGKRTYSMYLLHAFCLSGVERVLHIHIATISYLATVVIAFLITLAVASATHAWIEQPLIRTGRRLAKRYQTSHREMAVKTT